MNDLLDKESMLKQKNNDAIYSPHSLKRVFK